MPVCGHAQKYHAGKGCGWPFLPTERRFDERRCNCEDPDCSMTEEATMGNPAYICCDENRRCSKHAAADIRAALKAKGWGPKQVSVTHQTYAGGSSVSVRVRGAEPVMHEVKAIAERFARVRYDEYSGEILSGGNMFVHVSVSDEGMAAKAAPFLEAVTVALGAMPARDGDDQNMHRIIGTFDGQTYTVSNASRGWGFQLWSDHAMEMECDGARNLAYYLALAIERAKAGIDRYGQPLRKES